MKTMSWLAAFAVLTAVATHNVQAATLRVGEQDSCKVTGVTTIADKSISFDLSGVKVAGAVTSARLRLWVTVGEKDPYGRNFIMANWDKPDFDGFKVSDESGKVLDTVYPFYQTVACHEWNVTEAVKGKPGAGTMTLKTNFPLPPNDFEHAWKRVYLEITTTGEDADRPKQPTELKVKYRSGQVFLTWRQISFDGAFFDSTYRIYKHNAPITAASLGDATLVGEVNKNSQLNYRRTAYSYGGLMSYGSYAHLWDFIPIETDSPKDKVKNLDLLHAKLPKRFNFVIDEDWPKRIQDGKWLEDGKLVGDGTSMPQGPGLSDDTGLFVHTAAKNEEVFFAVTSVIRGNENRSDFSVANALTAPTHIKKDIPKPILQVVYNTGGRSPHQFREYVLWGGTQEGLHAEPSTPFMFQLSVHNNKLQSLEVGSIYTNQGKNGSDAAFDRSYMPPTRLAPFPVLNCSLTYGGSLSRSDTAKSFWIHGDTFYRPAAKASEAGNYGFDFPVAFGVVGIRDRDNVYGYHDFVNTGKDPRKATIVSYFQNRVLKALEIACAEFPGTDRNRAMYDGEGDAFLMGVHHSDIFATVGAAQFMPWSAKRLDRLWEMVGKREWALKNEHGVLVWNWNDPIWQSKQYPKKVWSYFSVCQAPNYSKADDFHHWQDAGYPKFYLDLQEEKRGGRWWWCDIGDAPHGAPTLVPLNQAYPAFTKVNFCETPQMQWRKEPRGTLNGYLSFGPNMDYLESIRKDKELTAKVTEGVKTVDTPELFEMAFRIGDHGLKLNGQSVPPTTARFGKTDITLWRLQQFKVAPGKKYRWLNKKIASAQVLQTGLITPDERELLTIPGFFVDRDGVGNKLIVTVEGGLPVEIVAVDTPVLTALHKDKAEPEVVELTYADYVKSCDNPVTTAMVKLPSTTFKISEFTQGGKCNADGEYTQQGGSFDSFVATTVNIPKSGHYVLTLRAKGGKGKAGNWPVVEANIGGRYGVKHKPRIINTTDYGEYRWYGDLEEGKLDIELVSPAIYYNLAMLPTLAEGRTTTYKDFTFTHIPETDAQKPVEIIVSPQGIAAPAGMPTRMTAQILNGLGKPLDAKVTWSCEGAEISADGMLKATAPGTCTITASAAGLETKVAVQISENFTEYFNEGCGALRSGWTAADLSEPVGTWGTPGSGHFMLNSLFQSSRPAVKSMLLWDPGTPWSNYEIQADMVICPIIKNVSDGVRGLVVCAKDKDNHIRLEIRRKGSEAVAAIVKRKGGTDSVLAENKTAPAYQPFDWKTNPMCPGLHALDMNPQKDMVMDRMRVQVKDDELRAWVADTALFPDGVKDADIGVGTIGLYSENACCFDNVVMKKQ